MSTDLTCLTPPSPSVLAALDLAALHVRRVSERLVDVAAAARRLAATTDWQTPAARAFFALAEHLAGEVAALGPVADAVRAEIAVARARAAFGGNGACR